MRNNEIQQLRSDLAQFTGTANYYRIDRKTLLTDGTYYLCEHAGAYWLITVFASYLHELKLEVGCTRFSRHGLKRIAPPRTVPDSRSPELNVGV